mmetsp:Transcript_4082/g.7263  ORF Transcript_4082/g.7263 Transcript_4082/m.7263 type:complete len:109 (-) Transcript_4082:312-638(-)
MRVISAYLLAVLGGNANPSAEDINKILSSVGVEADSERVSKLVSELQGKSVEEILAAGTQKLASVPAGGVAAAAPAAGAAAPAAAAPAPKKEEKEPSEEEDLGFSLFD